jgi:hypothetical protein
MGDDQIFVRFKGRTLGPFSLERAMDMKRRGQITRLHELSTDGMSWVRATEFELLFPKEPLTSSVAPEPAASPPVAADPFGPATTAFQDPFPQFNAAAAQASATPPPPSVEQPKDPKGLAITGFVLGLVSFFFPCCLPLPVVGIVLSARGLKSSARGMAIAGLILSIIGLLASLITTVFYLFFGGMVFLEAM